MRLTGVVQWLEEHLHEEMRAVDILRNATSIGINKTTLNKAKKILRVYSRKSSGQGGEWYWVPVHLQTAVEKLQMEHREKTGEFDRD